MKTKLIIIQILISFIFFSQIINTYKLPVETSDILDRVYIGESPFDAFDYKHLVELTIKHEKTVT